MTVYVLHHYFDTPDVEGNEIIGVYRSIEAARAKMNLCAAKPKKEFMDNVWETDMTWQEDNEIHLGFSEVCGGCPVATYYCWEIITAEVQ